MLAGLIDLPQGEIRGWGVFAHGFTLGKDSPAAARICRQLAGEGIGMLRFDNLGLGDSEGDWGDGSFTVKVDDTVEAVRFMAERGTPARLLVGHSWGGCAVLATAVRVDGVRAVATVGAPSDPSHAEHQYDAVIDRVLADGSAQWLVGGQKALTLKRAFVEDALRSGGEHCDNVTVIAMEWETPDSFESTRGVVTDSISDGVFASTIQAGVLDTLVEDLDDAAIERSIAEINEAIKRSAARKS